ncbi:MULTISPECIES: ABC transporter ATP-binding protein [unclassified Pseudomonas]|uniref:ABC transporter ATP-binding protein n=1 Tax=unclassified Pseudomonas TaxID=196821 RepID=UPI000F5726FC|nr:MULTISPECIES: ABC transporter ATP-binding protein [unclassified Pseudomonas]AZF03581.1 Gliding motility-associated ABC transporter ATP-binding protein GldA [Pseudomonas sp. R5-89-07]AZF46052.1 Gliding motility-associated ABC transporter ATP-binding protein GldA [Pseudomonas sp. R2-7-07]
MIEILNLTKRFSRHIAVDNLSLHVGSGEVLGVLGVNGAGKTTTMRMLTGFLAPTSGTIRILGLDVRRQTLQVQQQIGYLPEGAPCYVEMRVGGFLEFIAGARGYRGAERRERVERAIDMLELGGVVGLPITQLSKGFVRRVGLAQAILHDPKILILDEPTDGLDPNQKHKVRELIRRYGQDKTVVISTHLLEEVSAICSRAVILGAGKVLADSSPEELRRRCRYYQAVTLLIDGPIDLMALAMLPGVAGVEERKTGHCFTILARPGAVIFPAVSALVASRGWQVKALELERGRLDEVFRKITKAGKP